jgi:hypothetical protein
LACPVAFGSLNLGIVAEPGVKRALVATVVVLRIDTSVAVKAIESRKACTLAVNAGAMAIACSGAG